MANYDLDIQLKNHAPVVVNFEPLKAELTTALEDFKSKEYTEATIAEAKEDRAKLNKLKTVLDNERKTRKKEYMQPFEAFELQIKDLCSIVDEATASIGNQLDAFEQSRIAEKQATIQSLFDEVKSNYDALDFVTLNQIASDKWLNKTATEKSISVEITNRFEQISRDLEVISRLPYYYEAKESYKTTLDLNKALAEGERIAQIEASKREAALAEAQAKVETAKVVAETKEPEPLYDLTFSCRITKAQAVALKQFCDEHGINLIKV